MKCNTRAAGIIVAVVTALLGFSVGGSANAVTRYWDNATVTFRGHNPPDVSHVRWRNANVHGVHVSSITIKCGAKGSHAIHNMWETVRRVSDSQSLASRKLPAAACGHTYKTAGDVTVPNRQAIIELSGSIGEHSLSHRLRISYNNYLGTAD